MQHDEFIGHVQDRARLPSRGDAEAATRATLETLGERIPEPLAANLADQLPSEIGEHLRRTVVMDGAGAGERFGLQEFSERVAAREQTDPPAGLFHARVVLEVTDEATQDVLDKVAEALPDDLRAVVQAGSTGDLGGGGG